MSYYRPSIRSETLKLFNECKEIFIKTHPELTGISISEDYLFKRMCESYLEKLKWKLPIHPIK